MSGCPDTRLGRWTYRVDEDTWDWSETMFHIVGFEPGEVVPTLALLLHHTGREYRDRLAHVFSVVASTSGAFSCRFRLRDARGRERTVLLIGEHTGEGTQPRAVRGFFVDVTVGLARDTTAACDAAIVGVLEHRSVIERANGALMLACGVDDQSAFDLLRATSQDRNVKVHVLAEAFLGACAAGQTATSLTEAAAMDLLTEVARTAGSSVA